jgi:hypothetical protein
MKKTYTTTTEIWRHGLLVAVGTPIELTDAEAKYLGHALAKKPADAPATAPAETDEVATSSFDIHLLEVDSEDKPAKRRK